MSQFVKWLSRATGMPVVTTRRIDESTFLRCNMGGIAVDPKAIETKIVEALKTCYDPEIPVDIYELGLIYGVEVDPSGSVDVTMTLTSPNCPSAMELPAMVEAKVRSVPGVMDAKVEVVFDPPWEPSRMSEAARLQLGML